MTDQSAYVNAYIENIMGMVHDQLNQIIQLKTQIKVTEPLLAQKDATIADLSSKVTTSQHTDAEVTALKQKLRVTEDSFHALTNKVSHMETLQNQFNNVKKRLIEKEKEIEDLKAALENKTDEPSVIVVPKRKINSKNKKESVIEEMPNTESNDF